jgi:hypothetical protein
MEFLVAVLAVVLLIMLHLSCMCTQMLTKVVLAAEREPTHLQAKHANF